VNREWGRATGLGDAPLEGTDVLDLFPVKADLAVALHECARTGATFRFTIRAQDSWGAFEGTVSWAPPGCGGGFLVSAWPRLRLVPAPDIP
jgi:hypothetical protein